MKRIYLDYAATTPMHPAVLEAMLPYFNERFGNPSSIHAFGQEAKGAIERAREQVAALINSRPEEIIFTSGGTEANNLAIFGVCGANKGKHIITSSIEHHAVIEPCKYLAKQGYKITYLPVDKFGMVNPEEVINGLTKDTVLVSIMHANNEIGTIEPIEEISNKIKVISKKSILFHTDAVQSVSSIDVDVNKLDVDLLSMAGHKFYGPKGVGALYVRKGTKIAPFMLGGGQERGLRPTTENVAGIVGFGRACEIAKLRLFDRQKKLDTLREKLLNGIMAKVPDVFLNGHPEKRLPKNLNLSVKYIEGESIILNLDLEGIAASSGSACTSGSIEASHVQKAIGLEPALARGAVRFTLGRLTTDSDIEKVLEVFPRIVARLRAMSPLTKGGK
ncbi:MAG: cysteine desulfurase NifS [bacterium]